MSTSLRVLIPLLAIGSIGAGERPELQIINGTDQPASIFWLRPDGGREPNGKADPGESRFIQTTIGHRFAIVGRDGSEAVVEASLPVQAFRFQLPLPLGDGAVKVEDGRVVAPPSGAAVPPFYAKYLSAGGYPIVASSRVNDYALKEAGFLVNAMLTRRPDVRDAMIRSGSRLCIMAYDEFTTDLPEFESLADSRQPDGLDGKSFWDRRARGLGGSRHDPYCSCAEENLLGFPGDPYASENILIHEFAHSIHLRGMVNVDPTFDARLKETYDRAMAKGLWKGKYASVDPHEYFAEGVQSWFDDNRENDHDHNHVNTRAELQEYDPGLAALCREVFGDTVLVYTKPATRLSGHMEGYDPSLAPTFKWPARLERAHEAIFREVQERDRKANDASGRSEK